MATDPFLRLVVYPADNAVKQETWSSYCGDFKKAEVKLSVELFKKPYSRFSWEYWRDERTLELNLPVDEKHYQLTCKGWKWVTHGCLGLYKLEQTQMHSCSVKHTPISNPIDFLQSLTRTWLSQRERARDKKSVVWSVDQNTMILASDQSMNFLSLNRRS